MEEKKMSIKMKKTIATLLVTVGLAVATFCGVGLLSLAINTDALDVDVEDWLQDKEYRESDTLAWHMTSDMYSVVRYMGLQQMLEDNGTLNMERPALVAQYPDGSIVTYTMADLVAMGEENGIYVYDEAREMAGDVSYYITAPASGEMEDTRVRVLWSLTEKEDAAVDLGTDAWKIRQERIDEAIAYAKTAGVPTSVADGLIPDESVWDQLTTKELLELCQNLAARYPGTQAIEPQLLSLWSQELSDLQATEQDILNQIPAVEEATTEVATEPTQETTQSPDDEEALDETAPVEMPEQELDSMWSEELETVRRWENNLRDEMYEILQDRRGSQQTSWCHLYEELHVFLKSYLQEYYYLRRTMEEPGNLNYRIVLTQGDQTEIYTDVYTAENNGQLMGMENWDVSYSYDSTTRRIETTLPNSMREDPIQDLQTWSRYHYDSATITFGIDVDALLYEDSYQSEASSYVHYRNRVFLMVGTMAFCALLALVGMIWLMPLCGRRDGVEEIHLNLYDRLPTELGAFGIFLLFMGGCLVLVGARDFSYWIMYNTVAADVRDWMMTGIAAALLVLIYLILWLGLYGLIRRIKAHTFWKNSLCAIVLRWCLKPLGWCMSGLRWCGDKMKAGWMALVDNGDVTWKTAAVFIGYLLINFFLFLSYMNHYDGFFFLLMLAFNALVGVHLIIKSAERKRIRQGVTKIAAGHLDHHLPLQNLTGEEKKLAEQINRISGGLKTAVEDSLKNERMKTELITNVSHDIKTPLTSIIN
ncbi:MAG: HAMP domain-containing histidine kinase, partial [Lachnospiraceae bacterium]|nr:HAMP domain-containing histidine kinase [Lachnospiraceae bacterium]